MGGSQRCVCGMFRGFPRVSEGQGSKDPREAKATPRNPLGSPQSQGQGLRLDGQSQGMGGMSRCGKGGIPQGNPTTQHTPQHPWRDFPASSSRPSEAIKTGKRKKWRRKEKEEGRLLPIDASHVDFAKKKVGRQPRLFRAKCQTRFPRIDTAPREPRRKCHQRKVWMTGSKGLRMRWRADNPLSNGMFRSSLAPLDREKNRLKDHLPHSQRLLFW